MITEEELLERLSNPTETLQQELKGWFDPTTPEGRGKIVKSCIAMRNHDGGLIVLGIDKDGQHSKPNSLTPSMLEELSADSIQHLISDHASEYFVVESKFFDLKVGAVLVLQVAGDLRYPVVPRKEIKDTKNKTILKANTIYVRTIRSNGTVSSSEANAEDLRDLIDRCADNREGDPARFIRRNFPEILDCDLPRLLGRVRKRRADLGDASNGGPEESGDNSTPEKAAEDFLEESLRAFHNAVTRRGLTLPQHGYREASFQLVGSFEKLKPSQQFLDKVRGANPNLTGWPAWLDSRHFSNEEARPQLRSGFWEALIVTLDNDPFFRHIDFSRMSPAGLFYQYRALEDDVKVNDRILPNAHLEWALAVLRTADAIAVGLRIAKALGLEANGYLRFGFRWTGLSGRKLSWWANPERSLSYMRTAHDDRVTTFLNVPIDTSDQAISPFVQQVIDELFVVFEGFEIAPKVVDDLVTRLLNRRL